MFYVHIIELRLNSSMIWIEKIYKRSFIGFGADIKKMLPGGSAVLQEQLNPKPPEGMAIFGLYLLKASAAPDEGEITPKEISKGGK